jgi:hypothetical protein
MEPGGIDCRRLRIYAWHTFGRIGKKRTGDGFLISHWRESATLFLLAFVASEVIEMIRALGH